MINGLYINDNAPLRASIVNMGDMSRMKAVIAKARAGEPITLGFLGGSITAGSGSGEGRSYVECVTDFWSETFPECSVTCVNAGIGATGSILGVFRMEKDVLASKPDVLVIDHSVNDNGDEIKAPGSTRMTYESVIRRGILSGAAVVPLCFCERSGNSQRNMNLEIARHYDLPFISMVDGIYEPLVKSGKYEWSAYSGDSVHPNAMGHSMVGELIANYIRTVMADEADFSTDKKELPAPLFGDAYMNTEMLDGSSLIPDEYGAFEVGDLNFWQFKGGWRTEQGGSAMTFSLKRCKIVYLAFVRSVWEDSGTATVRVGDVTYSIDTYFKNGWGNFAQTIKIFDSDEPQDITVSITPNDAGKKFGLLRVMVAR